MKGIVNVMNAQIHLLVFSLATLIITACGGDGGSGGSGTVDTRWPVQLGSAEDDYAIGIATDTSG